MCSLMHVKAIGTKKSEILAKITFLGIFGQILPKAPIVQGRGRGYPQMRIYFVGTLTNNGARMAKMLRDITLNKDIRAERRVSRNIILDFIFLHLF